MSWGFLIFLALVLLLLLFSILRYLNTPLKPEFRLLLISIRILLVLLLLLSYLEPEIHLDRLNKNQTIPVLVDASSSMNLFKPDSSVIPFLQTLKNANQTSRYRKFVLFAFGDSLRELKDSDGLTFFTDKNSRFPPLLQNRKLQESRDIIIVSDANWTNEQFSVDQFSNRIIHYLPLSQKIIPPFLSLSTPVNIPATPADSSLLLNSTINGFTSEKSNLKVDLFHQNKLIESKDVETEPGYISKTVDIKLPGTTPGKHVYRIEVYDSLKNLYAIRHILRFATPETFTYSLQPGQNSLDMRFLKLGISRHPEFREIPFGKEKTDLLFFFRYDSLAIVKGPVKDQGIRVFTGTLPFRNTTTIPVKKDFSFIPPPPASSLASLKTEDLPPPSSVLTSKELIPIQTLLSANIFYQSQKLTVPLICLTEFLHKPSFILAGSDFWRWDFWPLSVTQSEENAFSFSSILISILKDQLLNSLSDAFHMYTTSIIKENDSIPFLLSLPTSISNQSRVNITLEIRDMSGASVIQQPYPVTRTGSSNQSIMVKPLPEGRYSYTAKFSYLKKQYSFSDIIQVQKNQAEITINDQNRALLEQIGQPVDLQNQLSFAKHVLSDQSGTDELIRVNVKIARGWALLAAIFLLFSIEWILRRYLTLD
ncbi:MAG: hypothetical protein GX640_17015 [Fibrobacter sp.]|nr:hypothetical protein [Fibrobacter sp.]